MRVLAGTSGFSYKEWKGSFYPEKLKNDAMLRFYAERFPTVEINNTFYRMPTAQLLATWAAQVPATFAFALKAPQKITHIKRLGNAREDVAFFLDAARTLGPRLGCVFFQTPPYFRKDASRLSAFLALLPRDLRAAFEFRHESWFDDEVYGLLRGNDAALCLADTGEESAAAGLVATASWGYVRLRRPEYTDDDLTAWAARIRAQPWETAFVFFKHEDAGTGPRLAARLQERFAP
jgi:uncharacterized protein YecE (DUF72 family)